MEKNLTVAIFGEIADGKTTVAEIISNALKQHGFNVTYSNTEDREMSDERKAERIAALAPITEIKIQEVTVKREPIEI